MNRLIKILKNPDVQVGIFAPFLALMGIFFLFDYVQTDENLKDAKKVSEIKNQIKNEIKKLNVIKNIALLEIKDKSKPRSSIGLGSILLVNDHLF